MTIQKWEQPPTDDSSPEFKKQISEIVDQATADVVKEIGAHAKLFDELAIDLAKSVATIAAIKGYTLGVETATAIFEQPHDDELR